MCKTIFALFLFIIVPNISFARENDTLSNDVLNEFNKEFSLKYAANNLQENRIFYIKMLEKVDGASGLAWEKILGNKLTSQPIAVIKILSQSQVNIESVCPPFFPEDTPDSTIIAWNQSAIDVLSSFKMNDGENEMTRQQCLKSIIQVNENLHMKK